VARKKVLQVNPRHSDVKKAMKLYSEFREAKPQRGRTIEKDWPQVLMNIGNVRFIGYDTTRRGKTELYKHEFAPGSRPILCSDDKGQLYIMGGRYHFKVGKLNGIVDIDAAGKDIDDGA
jgi:hypothetical protein